MADVQAKLKSSKTWAEEDFVKMAYHDKAGEICKESETKSVPYGIGIFFDSYVHDSYASFIGFFMTKRMAPSSVGLVAPSISLPKQSAI